jgi:outer membrane receptor for ferrienterochelin and colicin
MFKRFIHKSLVKSLLLLIIFTNLSNFLYSQNDTSKLFDINIDSLVKLKVAKKNVDSLSFSYANFKPYTILTITKKDIEKTGAQDLMQVLRSLSQIEFGTDVINQLGIYVNGIWANEGKVLILIDGHLLN